MTESSSTKTKRKGFSWAGIAALPVGLVGGTLIGVLVGTEPGHIAIGAAVGTGMGVGIGVAWIFDPARRARRIEAKARKTA